MAPSATKAKVPIPSVESLRPSIFHVLAHALVHLTRFGTLATLASLLIVQPIYHSVYLQLPFVRSMNDVIFLVFTFAFVCHALPWATFNSCFSLFDSLHPQHGTNPLKRVAPFSALGRYMARHKLPRQRHQLPSWALIRKTVRSALVEQYLIIPVVLYLTARFLVDPATVPPRETAVQGFSAADIQAYKAGQNVVSMLRAFLTLALHFMAAELVNEVGFYIAHSVLHSHPTLYRVFHKQHHQYVGTVSISAEYATPLEGVVANGLPSTAYFAFMFFKDSISYPSGYVQAARAWPLFVTWMWARLWETYETHSGYCFADTLLGRIGLLHGNRARFHDYHHTHNVSNYGASIIMDGLFGTMDPYLLHRYREKMEGAERADEDPGETTTAKSK